MDNYSRAMRTAAIFFCSLACILALICTTSAVSYGQINGALAPDFVPTLLNGTATSPAALGYICTQASGTSNLLSTYQDDALTVANQNPIRLDASGRPINGASLVSVFLKAQAYRMSVYAAGVGNTCNGVTMGTLIRQVDPVYDFAELYANGQTALLRIIPCQTGTNFSAKFAAAAALLPSTGGVVDCRNLQGAQTITSDTYSTQTVPITLLWPTGTVSSSVSLTFPATMTVDFPQGGILSMASATTATISGGFTAPLTQVFAGAGSVLFGTPSTDAFFGRIGSETCKVPRVYPQWFGALGNSTTGTNGNDDTPAINAALAAAAACNGGTLYFRTGGYRITSSLNYSDLWGNLTTDGDGEYRSNIYCNFSNNPCFDLTGSSRLTFRNFGLRTAGGATPTEGFLLARKSGNNSAGAHQFNHIYAECSCLHATLVLYGSEQNYFANSYLASSGGGAGTNDGPAIVGAMGSSTPPGGGGTMAGWTPASPFVAIGTGEGGNSSNTFINMDVESPSTDPMTRSLIYLWGMHETAFYNLFTSSGAPATVDARLIPYPSGGGNYYKTTATMDTWADENPVTAVSNKESVEFSSPGVTSEPSIRGFHIRNSWTFQIHGDDNTWIDDLEYMGGHYSASVPSPTGAKLSIYRLDNSIIKPSLFERALTYTIRNQGSGIVMSGIPLANISLTNVTGFQNLVDPSTGYSNLQGLLASSPLLGVGYGTGAGGTVTQITSKSTGVTLNKVAGQIIMNNANLVAGTTVGFTVTDSAVTSTDVVIVNIQSGSTTNSYAVNVTVIGGGLFRIELRNTSGGDLAEAPVLNFAVLKGVIN